MNDKTLMLDEDETLGLLRAGRTGATEPTLIDITDSAIAGGRRMRMRRWTARTGGALVLAAAASLAIATAMPDLSMGRQPVVQPADGGDNGGPSSVIVTEVDAEFTNRQVLAEALGPDFRVRVTGGSPRFATIELVPDSPAAKRLPAGYSAETAVEVAPGFTQVDEPCNPADPAAKTGTCAHRPLADGGEVLHSTLRSDDGEGYFAALKNAYFTRPDGQLVRATLSLYPRDKGTKIDDRTKTEVLAWLASFEDRLSAAVTDPRLTPADTVTSTQTSDARYQEERNYDYLLEALGQGWAPLGAGFEAEPGSATASGLPAGYRGRANVRVAENSESLAEFCRKALPRGATCKVREIPGGGDVAIQILPVSYSGTTASAEFLVVYVQPTTGDAVSAEVSVFGQGVSASEPASVRDQVLTWMTGFEDKLIRAATDTRMAENTENLPAEAG